MSEVKTWDEASNSQRESLRRYNELLNKFNVRNELPLEEAKELMQMVDEIGYLSSGDIPNEGEEI